MFRTLSPEVSILVTQKTTPRRQEGKSGSMLLCNRRRRQFEHQRSVFSILCMGRCKPLGSLNLFLSYAPQLSGANHVSLFTFWSGRWLSLAFPQLLRSHLWVAVADSTGSQFGDPSFTFGGQKLLMVVMFHIYWQRQETFSFHDDLSLSSIYGVLFLSSVVLSLECEDNCRVRENLHRNTGPLSYEVEYWLPVWIASEFEAGQGQKRAAAVSGPG